MFKKRLTQSYRDRRIDFDLALDPQQTFVDQKEAKANTDHNCDQELEKGYCTATNVTFAEHMVSSPESSVWTST